MPPLRTFADFVPTVSTATAYRLARAVADDTPGARTNLVLQGPSSCGKSHLLAATAAAFRSRYPGAHVVSTSARELRRLLLVAIRGERAASAYDGFGAPDLLLVDDLQDLADAPATQQIIGEHWQAWAGSGMRLIGASSAPLRRLAAFRDAANGATNRSAATMWVPIRKPTLRDRRLLLRTFLSARAGSRDSIACHRDPAGTRGDARLVNHVVAYTVRACAGDVRRLIGAATHWRASAQLGNPTSPPWLNR
jgi:chromosomal replication initiation ATPase DnaA